MKICLNRNIEFFSSFCINSIAFHYNFLPLCRSYCSAAVLVYARRVRTKQEKRDREKLAGARWQFILSIFFREYFCFHNALSLVGYIIYCKRVYSPKWNNAVSYKRAKNWNDYAILLNWNGNPLSDATCGVTRFSKQKKIFIFDFDIFCACLFRDGFDEMAKATLGNENKIYVEKNVNVALLSIPTDFQRLSEELDFFLWHIFWGLYDFFRSVFFNK